MVDFFLFFGTKKRRRNVMVMIMVIVRPFFEGLLCARCTVLILERFHNFHVVVTLKLGLADS